MIRSTKAEETHGEEAYNSFLLCCVQFYSFVSRSFVRVVVS